MTTQTTTGFPLNSDRAVRMVLASRVIIFGRAAGIVADEGARSSNPERLPDVDAIFDRDTAGAVLAWRVW